MKNIILIISLLSTVYLQAQTPAMDYSPNLTLEVKLPGKSYFEPFTGCRAEILKYQAKMTKKAPLPQNVTDSTLLIIPNDLDNDAEGNGQRDVLEKQDDGTWKRIFTDVSSDGVKYLANVKHDRFGGILPIYNYRVVN